MTGWSWVVAPAAQPLAWSHQFSGVSPRLQERVPTEYPTMPPVAP
jgi:hypothetical protein